MHKRWLLYNWCRHMNTVALHQASLVPRWLTAGGHTVLILNGYSGQLSLAVRPCLGATSTGDGDSHCWGRRGKFCVSVRFEFGLCASLTGFNLRCLSVAQIVMRLHATDLAVYVKSFCCWYRLLMLLSWWRGMLQDGVLARTCSHLWCTPACSCLLSASAFLASQAVRYWA